MLTFEALNLVPRNAFTVDFEQVFSCRTDTADQSHKLRTLINNDITSLKSEISSLGPFL